MVGHVFHFAFREQQTSNGLGIGHRVHFTLLQRKAELARGENTPRDLLSRIDAVGTEHAICEDERRRSHAGHADPFSAQLLNCVDAAVRASLHAQTTAMNSPRKLHLQSLLDRLKEVHD